jgi:hypothetical protein
LQTVKKCHIFITTPLPVAWGLGRDQRDVVAAAAGDAWRGTGACGPGLTALPAFPHHRHHHEATLAHAAHVKTTLSHAAKSKTM